MNFLAHVYLSPPTSDARLGSLLGDFVKGPVEQAGYNAEITAAIRLHRAIDTFTDAHPVVLASKARISPARRRYAGILVDIFYDHFLATGWDDHHDAPLEHFSVEVYDALRTHRHPVSERFAAMASHLVDDDWFGTYRSIAGIDTTLARMGRRLRPDAPIRDAVIELEANYEALREDFRAFIPDLRAAVAVRIAGSLPTG
jgi:acyl carrier protein phosphodiesterase